MRSGGVHDGISCIGRSDNPLPITGDDKWLLISDPNGNLNKDSIPPYYYLNCAVPDGLNIVLSIHLIMMVQDIGQLKHIWLLAGLLSWV